MPKPLDRDFETEDEDDRNWTPPEPQEVFPETKTGNVSVEVSDDAPEEDRGKWVADDTRDGEPDFPNEDEVRGYAKGAQKRISQMTARIHAERRRADEIAREHAVAVDVARRLVSENNALKDFVQKGEQVLMGEHQGRLRSVLE